MVPWIRAYGSWEPEESALVRSWLRGGMTMIDVGSHVGYYTALAAARVGRRGRVLSFEPDRDNYDLLVHNVSGRGLRNVVALNAAAWDATEALSLARSLDNTGDHRVHRVLPGGAAAVAAFAVDDIVPSRLRVDVVKIDTQGTDHRVVAGLTETIRRWRPRICLEFWPDGINDVEPASLPGYYASLGYKVRALEAPGLRGDAAGSSFVEAAAESAHGFLTLILEPVSAASG